MTPRLLTCALCLTLFLAYAPTPTRAQEMVIDNEERNLLHLINVYRAQHGLVALKLSYALTRCAEWMSNDMAARNYLDHIDSANRDSFKRMTAFSYGYKGARGENLGGGLSDADRMFNLWKDSSTHNKVMLDSNLRVVGISRAFAPNTQLRWYWAANFGGYTDATMEVTKQAEAVLVTMNPASRLEKVAPESVATSTGKGLSTCQAEADRAVLPTMLCNTSVLVNGVVARLYSVSPTQINYVVPPGIASGVAKVDVLNGASLVASGTVTVDSFSPGLFAISRRGQRTAGSEENDIYHRYIAPADGKAAGAEKEGQLALYGTGLRSRRNLNGVQIKVDGIPVAAQLASPQETAEGIDLVKVFLPPQLQRRSEVEITMTAAGCEVQPVKIKLDQQTAER